METHYDTDLTDKQWQIIKKMIPQQKQGPKQIDRRRFTGGVSFCRMSALSRNTDCQVLFGESTRMATTKRNRTANVTFAGCAIGRVLPPDDTSTT